MTTEKQIRDKIKIFRPKSQVISLFDYNLNDNATRVFKFQDKLGNKIRIWNFTNTISIEIPTGIALNFAINIPDKLCLSNILLEDIKEIGKIYSREKCDKQILNCVKLLYNDLKSLQLNTNEGLIVFKNSLQLILNPSREILTEIETLTKIKSIIEINFPDKDSKDDYVDLTTELKKILLDYKNLAILDDLERDDKIQTLTKKQRKDFIETLEPKLENINEFLGTFGDKPLSEGAIRLQCLAELLIELTYEDGKKNHS